MNLETLEARLTDQRTQLAEIEAERATLEAERQTIEANKKALAGKAILDKDPEAAETLRRYNARLGECFTRDEDLANAAGICSDRISGTLGEIVAEKKRLAAIEGSEIARKRVEAAKEFEQHVQAAAKAAQYLKDSGPTINDYARQIDAQAANGFSSRLLAGRLEERLAVHFKPFGCREMVANRDATLDAQLHGEVHFFEGWI